MSGIECVVQVEAEDAGKRLDKWLTEALLELDYEVSRSQIQEWIQAKYIIGPKNKVKASDVLTEAQEYHIQVPAPEPVEILPDDVAFDIVYEDEHVVVVNKPRGLVVHPAAGHPRGTLINGLVHRGVKLSQLGGEMRPGVVHRIDKDTSGLLMLAKSDLAYHKLASQLKEHTVLRHYQAIVHGKLTHDTGIIDAPIGRDVKNRQRMAVVDDGKHAVTHFHVKERFTDYTHVELRLETGRTHQIRVHMSYIGHPLAGDPVYGRRHTLQIHGQALHAMTLGFHHPQTSELLTFTAELPVDMETLLAELRKE